MQIIEGWHLAPPPFQWTGVFSIVGNILIERVEAVVASSLVLLVPLEPECGLPPPEAVPLGTEKWVAAEEENLGTSDTQARACTSARSARAVHFVLACRQRLRKMHLRAGGGRRLHVCTLLSRPGNALKPNLSKNGYGRYTGSYTFVR